ncbi:hypothetical protein EsH8_III_000988 [Colletotrichum jinshuiense]
MSGFEIAGIVLGAFPILYDTAKDLGTVLKKTKSWWQFETSFENFVSAIATQEIAYTQVLKRLLDPLDITDDEYESLLRDPRSGLWYEHHIQGELRQRLPQNEYTWFMWNLSELNEALTGLQRLLPLNKVYHLDSTSLESELYRLQTSFSDKKNHLLTRITDINDKLHTFLDRGSGVTRQSATKPSIPFRDLHGHAVAFYECLAQRWQCCCSAAHTVGITTSPAVLKSSKTTKNGYFNVLFEAEAGRKQLSLQVDAFAAAKPKTNGGSAGARAQTLDVEAALELKSQIVVKKQLKVAADAAGEKSVSALAITALSISGHGIETPRKSILRSVTKKIKKLPHWRGADAEPNASLPKTSFKQGSSISSLGKTLAPDTTATPKNGSSLNVASEGELSRSQSSISASSRVRFTDEGSPPSPPEANEARMGEMKDICKFVTSAEPPRDGSDSLSLDEGRGVVLKPSPLDQSTLKASTTQSIDAFLQTTSVRQSRLYMGLSFALTLLCLATSSWIPAQLAKSDVFLVCCGPGAGPGGRAKRSFGPYFSRNSREICAPPAPAPAQRRAWDAKSSLLLLGVVLLELFHGQTLEQQPSWAESLDEDGRPNESTRFCGAFLWACRAEEPLRVHFGRELGGALHEAIRKCICFDFGRDDEFGDARLAEVVYREVVVPLEKCCPQF